MKNKISILIVLSFLLTSCSLFKKTTKTEVKNEAKTEVKLDSSATEKTETVDKTKTVVTEKSKGVEYTKPIEAKSEFDLTDLLTGLQVVKDSGLVRITQSYDTLSKAITTKVEVKPQAVEYYVDKQTVIENDINAKVDAAVKVKRDSLATVKQSHTKSTSTPSLLIWVITGLTVAALLLGIYLYKQKRGL